MTKWTRAQLALTVACGLIAAATLTARREPPRLVVLLVVDQFRADYVTTYGARWTKGLRRLFDTGAVFQQAAYPYLGTETCPGHATIGTGAFPMTHGMVANSWYDRTSGKAIVCTDDPSVTSVPFAGGMGTEHHGPRWLLVPTFADELRAQSSHPPHIVSLSIKARAAIGMAGHGGDAVVWLEDGSPLASSSAYGKTANAAADAFVKANSIDADFGKVWDRLLPASTYLFDDDGLAEQAPDGWTTMFPHTLTRPTDEPDRIYYDNWTRTPMSDEYLGRMGAALSKDMGQGPGTDMLAIGFSALDIAGHRFGPKSHEVQDILLRLDATIGRLLDTLDQSVGAGRYVVALSADHGVSPIPEQMTALGLDAGRLVPADVGPRIDAALRPILGPGTYVAFSTYSDVYFAPGVMDRLRANDTARRVAAAAALATPGIARVFWGEDLAGHTASGDSTIRALALNYVAGRSGDLLMAPKPYWVNASGGTGHGTANDYDQRVPLVLAGAGIKPGQYFGAVTPADIAPTFALLTGITLAHADGHPLVEAIIK
jgi:predicted AlkP superfamily pyrophosphatase or phosphodiesterase